MTGSGVDEGKKYIAFVRGNMDQVDKKITDDLWALSAIEVQLTNKYIIHTYIYIYKPFEYRRKDKHKFVFLEMVF